MTTPKQDWKRFYSLVRYCRRTHGYVKTYFDAAEINGVHLVCDLTGQEIYRNRDSGEQYEVVRRISFFEMLDDARTDCNKSSRRQSLQIARRELESSACGFNLP